MAMKGGRATVVVVLFMVTRAAVVVVAQVNLTCPEISPCDCERRRRTEAPSTGPEQEENVIDCHKRGLTEIPEFLPLTGRSFDRLLLTENSLTSLARSAFQGLGAIREIDLSDNEQLASFSNFAFRHLTGLEVLTIERAQLSSVPVAFRDLSALRELRLGRNSIRRLPPTAFSAMTELLHLDLRHNQAEFPLPFTAFESLAKLEYLNLESNDLYNYPVEALASTPSLHTLILSHNHIRVLPLAELQKLKGLKRLELVGNPLDLPTSGEASLLPGMPLLEVLSLGGLKLGSVTSTSLSDLPRLTNLTLRDCQLPEIPAGTFGALGRLRALDISDNPLQLKAGIFRGVERRLQLLKLERLNLTAYPSELLARFPVLKDVFLAHNHITSVPAAIFRRLPYRGASIWLDGNLIDDVSPDVMAGVRRPASLGLAHNEIRSLDFITRRPCSFDDVFVDLRDNPVHCDCAVYLLAQRKIFELNGACSTPQHHAGLQLVWSSPDRPPHLLQYLEHSANASDACAETQRRQERYECTCGTWQDVRSPDVCPVVGGAPPTGGRPPPPMAVVLTTATLVAGLLVGLPQWNSI